MTRNVYIARVRDRKGEGNMDCMSKEDRERAFGPDRSKVPGRWTDKDHGLAFCDECLTSMKEQYGPQYEGEWEEYPSDPIEDSDGEVECENCGESLR